MVKNSPVSAGDVRDGSSVPELERSPGGGHGDSSSILAGESHGHRSHGYSPWGREESNTTEAA